MPASFASIAYLLAAGAGLSFVFQQAVNANLRAEIDSPWWAGFISYLGGTLAMLSVAMALREPWPSMQTIQRGHLISWRGGLFGAVYIAISILLIPRLGAAMVIALIGTGQMIGSLAFDHFGLFGVPVHSLSVSRRIGDERPDLDENRAWPYSPRMINASTILIARRRRAIAVWAVVCV